MKKKIAEITVLAETVARKQFMFYHVFWNQSGFEINTCDRHRARENEYQDVIKGNYTENLFSP